MTESTASRETEVSALRGGLTQNGSFFTRRHFGIPRLELETWRFAVDGDVARPQEFHYDELTKLRQSTVTATIECAGNGRAGFKKPAPGEFPWGVGAVGNATWTGVSLSEILRRVGGSPTATEVVAEGWDSGPELGSGRTISFARSLPIGKARAKGTLVALRMNGRRLTPEHGFPARLIVPGWYGMASVKWLRKLTFRKRGRHEGFFNSVKYVYSTRREDSVMIEPVREMRVKSLLTDPPDGGRVKVGSKVRIRGKAWSGSGRISRVQVKLDEGAWEEARIMGGGSGYGWTAWTKGWTPTRRGTVLVSSRAADEAGNVQPAEPMENAFQYGYNAVSSVRVTVE